MMTVCEDEFWADGGTYEQINDRVDNYIIANRDVKVCDSDELEERIAFYESSGAGYRLYVSFSAYPDDYRDNLDEIAVDGRVQFVEEVPKPWGSHDFMFGCAPYEDRKKYVSPVMENPTWLEVALLANDMINATGDTHHIYLETIRPSDKLFTLDDKSFVNIYRFSMGS